MVNTINNKYRDFFFTRIEIFRKKKHKFEIHPQKKINTKSISKFVFKGDRYFILFNILMFDVNVIYLFINHFVVNTLIAKNTKMDEDILQELTLEDIELLSQKYSSFQREAPHVCSLLKTQILWKRRKPDLRGLTFFGVKNNWLESGTFILLSEVSLIIFVLNHLFKSPIIFQIDLCKS